MYSFEIEQLLKIRNYLLSNEEYISVIDTSPQIDHIKYLPCSNEFEMWTDDKYYFKYKVYRKK